MKYKDIVSPWDKMQQLRNEHGWEKSSIISYNYFLNKYMQPVPDQNSMLVKSFKFLMAGRLYTYKYDPLYKDKLDYYDKRPVMLCIKNYIHPKTGNNLQLGINFNFIPPEMRVFILTGIWNTFKNMIKQDLSGRPTKDGRSPGRQKLLFTDNFDVYGLLDYVLETVGRTYWKFAIRQYIWERIEFAKWIDYPDWGYIPMLQSKDMVGISERELAKIYWKEKNKNL